MLFWKRVCVSCSVLLATLSIATTASASYKTTIGGITVKYSKNGAEAYYDAYDSTLTVSVWEDGGVLSVIASPSSCGIWGDYADIFFDASYASIKKVSLAGRSCIGLFVAGQVGLLNDLSLKHGVVGGTDFYGDTGLGMTYYWLPKNISIKTGFAVGPVLGVSYSVFLDQAVADAEMLGDTSGSAKKSYRRAPAIDKESLVDRLQEN